MSIEKSGCERFCKKTGDCLLDKVKYVAQNRDLIEAEAQTDLIEDLKIAFPKRAKAYNLIYKDSQARMHDEFESTEEWEEEEFVWSGAVECARPSREWIGKYAVTTYIGIDEKIETYLDFDSESPNLEPLDHTITREEYEVFGELPEKATYRRSVR